MSAVTTQGPGYPPEGLDEKHVDYRNEDIAGTVDGDEAYEKHAGDPGLDIAGSAVKSRYDNLTPKQAMFKFKRMFLTGVLASLGSM